MGNCQAAEAATVVIQHPVAENGKAKVERLFYSVTANHVMNSNPGYYVALVLQSPAPSNRPPPRHQLKLLRPDDTLHIGHVYCLISFEDVLKEFWAKKSVKLGKLLKESGVIGVEKMKKIDGDGGGGGGGSQLDNKMQMQGAGYRLASFGMSSSSNSSRVIVGRHIVVGRGQWKPALQSIAESATS